MPIHIGVYDKFILIPESLLENDDQHLEACSNAAHWFHLQPHFNSNSTEAVIFCNFRLSDLRRVCQCESALDKWHFQWILQRGQRNDSTDHSETFVTVFEPAQFSALGAVNHSDHDQVRSFIILPNLSRHGSAPSLLFQAIAPYHANGACRSHRSSLINLFQYGKYAILPVFNLAFFHRTMLLITWRIMFNVCLHL